MKKYSKIRNFKEEKAVPIMKEKMRYFVKKIT